MEEETNTQTQRLKPKFNASLEFPALPPYSDFFAERVPLLQAFTLALAECHRRGTNSGERYFAAECGVYKGNSLIACNELAKCHGINMQFLGFDTFKGLPEVSETDRRYAPDGATHMDRELFADTSIQSVRAKLAKHGFADTNKLWAGLFSDSFPKVGLRDYVFVNVDCDLYEGHLECLEYFYPRMLSGGVLFFDDYHSKYYPAAKRAVDRFMADKPEDLMQLRFGKRRTNHTKCFVIKY